MRKIAALLALALACLLPAASAQSLATGALVAGTVRDESGAVLRGAAVTVVEVETNLSRSAASDDRGRYVVAALPPGTYRITVALDRFAPAAREGLALVLGQELELNFSLQLAGAVEEVTVVGEAAMVDPGQTAVATVVGQRQIESLPINLRNFLSFSVITPGVTNDRTPQQGASATSGLSFAAMFGFEPSAEQKTLVDSVRRFAAREMRPRSREADERAELPRDLTRAGWELGLLPASLPEAYGGFGERSAVTGALFAEELAWGDVSAALALMAPALVALPVLLAGTNVQRHELLPAFCGESYVPGSAALLEPRLDFDARRLRTQATREGDDWVLDGAKCNVPCAEESEWMVVYASCEGRTEAFLVRRGTPGLVVGEREQNMGLHALPLYAVELRGCRVPSAMRLGGDAGGDMGPLLDASRVAQAALAVGVARAAYEYALEYAKGRQAFGEAIGQRQAIAFMLAEMATEVEAARLLAWEAAWTLDQGRDATREACLAKTFADEMVLMVTDRAVQVLGGHGYILDHPVELWLRNGRAFAVLEGMAIV